jgi:hypothetical protein
MPVMISREISPRSMLLSLCLTIGALVLAMVLLASSSAFIVKGSTQYGPDNTALSVQKARSALPSTPFETVDPRTQLPCSCLAFKPK